MNTWTFKLILVPFLAISANGLILIQYPVFLVGQIYYVRVIFWPYFPTPLTKLQIMGPLDLFEPATLICLLLGGKSLHCSEMTILLLAYMWGESKILLVKFFNSLEKVAHQSLKFNGVLKTCRRLKHYWKQRIGRSAMHRVHRRKDRWRVGWLPSRPTSREQTEQMGAVDRLVDRPERWF